MHKSLRITSCNILSLPITFISAMIFISSLSFSQVGKFSNQNNMGKTSLKGKVEYNSKKATYKIIGSGENIWGNKDAFFFVYKKLQNDVILQTDIKWIGEGKNPHRKAGIMMRTGLEEDAAYVDAVIHGDGLVSMQFRKTKGDITSEFQTKLKPPLTLKLEKTGDQYTLLVKQKNDKFSRVGTINVDLGQEIYGGLLVCSHDSTTYETAIFSNVNVEESVSVPDEKRIVESTLEIIDIETCVRSTVITGKNHLEAPNWSRDGKTLIYNCEGKIYTIPVKGGKSKLLYTGFADRCNNDHGISPDGKFFVISHHQKEDGKSMIYTLPIKGGEPKLITKLGPSYWHGWSPDGKRLAYCAERNGEYDVYTIPAEGGEETRLTIATGLDDGPDYSPDGKYIYFNSVRTGQMKIWRMNTDGSEQIQITPDDNYGDWFAHPSPDNKWLVFISYDKSVEGHPANKNVVLRIMPINGGEPKVLATLFGGQGTINVPSWSPDSKNVAFVSYRMVAPKTHR